MTYPKFAQVAILRPIRRSFEYSIPEELGDRVSKGSLCNCPFRGESERGVVLETGEEPEYQGERKELSEVISGEPLREPLLELANWLSFATFTPLGQVFNRMLPADITARPRTRDAIELKASFSEVSDFIEREKKRKPKQAELLQCLLASDEPIEKSELLARADSSRSPLKTLLSEEFVEEVTLPEIEARPSFSPAEMSGESISVSSGEVDRIPASFEKYVAYGTGRERIAIYKEILARLTRQGTVILLSPNVIRAEELVELIRSELDLVGVTYHSELTGGQISRRWNLARSGDVDFFVGALSAVYLPVDRLGGIIVEGEGDRNFSLKEQDPKGNLIDIALRRGELEESPVILGGPGPSLRSYLGLERKEYREISGASLDGLRSSSRVSFIKKRNNAEARTLSSGVRQRLKENYENKELSLIIGEKTGSSSAAVCEDCGEVIRCPDCQVPISYTTSGNYGVCPYCGARKNLLACPICGSDEIDFIGGGLEKAGTEIKEFLPGANVRRFDAPGESPADFMAVRQGFLKGEIDILLGTSIVASPCFSGEVSLVGLLDLDLILNRPTYRSTELAFRRVITGLELAAPEGELVVQTYGSGTGSISSAFAGAPRDFYESELKSRKRMGYPPYRRLITVQLEGKEREDLRKVASKLRGDLESTGGDFTVLGPLEPESDKTGRTRTELVIKAEELDFFLEILHEVISEEDVDALRVNPFT